MSRFLRLGVRDFLKGAVVAVLTGVGTALTTLESLDLKKIGMAALIAFIAYLAKNLVTNSQDQILKTD
jgi:hypothetical protein